MGLTRSVIPDRDFKRQQLEQKKQSEEDFIGKISNDIMPMTYGNDTKPPKYEPGEDNGSDNNNVDDDNDIFPTPGGDI